MSKHRLSEENQKQIAHYITQRCINHLSNPTPGEYLKTTQEYLEVYNSVMDKLEEYNTTIRS